MKKYFCGQAEHVAEVAHYMLHTLFHLAPTVVLVLLPLCYCCVYVPPSCRLAA